MATIYAFFKSNNPYCTREKDKIFELQERLLSGANPKKQGMQGN